MNALKSHRAHRSRYRHNASVTPKADRPETVREAVRWETTKNRYLGDGLCHKCAAQAAWGHQIGFSRLEHQPCGACAPAVAVMPRPQPNAWRSATRGDTRQTLSEAPA